MIESSTGSKVIRPGLGRFSKTGVPSEILEANTSSFDVVEFEKDVGGVSVRDAGGKSGEGEESEEK